MQQQYLTYTRCGITWSEQAGMLLLSLTQTWKRRLFYKFRKNCNLFLRIWTFVYRTDSFLKSLRNRFGFELLILLFLKNITFYFLCMFRVRNRLEMLCIYFLQISSVWYTNFFLRGLLWNLQTVITKGSSRNIPPMLQMQKLCFAVFVWVRTPQIMLNSDFILLHRKGEEIFLCFLLVFHTEILFEITWSIFL